MRAESRKQLFTPTDPAFACCTWWWSFTTKIPDEVIRISTDAAANRRQTTRERWLLKQAETGPPLQLDVFGTGFLVGRDGRLLTNHHVAEPWWGNDELKQLLDQGAVAFVASYTAYFPGTSQGIAAKLGQISSHADLATLKLAAAAPPTPQVETR